MSAEEVQDFSRSPNWQSMVRVRTWDDRAKTPGAEVQGNRILRPQSPLSLRERVRVRVNGVKTCPARCYHPVKLRMRLPCAEVPDLETYRELITTHLSRQQEDN